MADTHDTPTGSTISLRTSSPVLVGRSAELATLVGAVGHLPAVVLIEGEAGVGKTRLVNELLADPVTQRMNVLSGACQRLRAPFPYGPVVEALRSTGELLRAEPSFGPMAGAVRAILPEVAHLLPAQPVTPGGPSAERHLLYRGVRDLLAALAPVLLVIEDVHWADEDTRDMLAFLTAQPVRDVAIVITYRHEGRAAGMPLGSAYRHPEGTSSAVIRLAPLAQDEVRDLAAAIVGGQAVTADFAGRLHERTGGVPFVVEETLRALRDPAGAVRTTGATVRRLLDAVEVPTLLREAMAERLADASAETILLAQAAAVLGEPARATLLAAVAGVAADQAAALLIEALRGSVLVEVGGRRYGFRHALARQAVYDTLTGPECERLHARAADALADSGQLLRIAAHHRAAGMAAEWARSGEAAADQAAQAGAPVLATELFQELLEQADLAPGGVDRLARKLSLVAHNVVGQRDIAALLDRLLRDPRLSGEALGEVRLNLGVLLLRQPGSLSEARTQLELAVAELAEHDPGQALYGMSVLAEPDKGVTPLAEHERWLREVDEGLRRCTDPVLRTKVRANQLHTLVQIGDAGVWRRVAELPASGPDPEQRRQLARLHGNLGDACAWIGEYRAAQRFLRTCRGLLASCDDPPYLLSVALTTELHLDWLTGRWTTLAERIGQLLELYPDLQNVDGELTLIAGRLALARGELAEADRYLALTGVEQPEHAFAPVAITACAAQARVRLGRHEPEQARAVALRGLAQARRKGVWVWAAELIPVAMHVLERAQARQVGEEFLAGVAGRRAPLATAAAEAVHGYLHRADGDLVTATKYFEKAGEAYARLPYPYKAALAEEQAACCRLEIDRAEGTATMLRAAAAFDALGAARDAARCKHLVRSKGTGVPSRRGRRGYGDALSPREREVARLLARGNTNREIAKALFLSPRTVEHHVAKVLRKLGTTNRSDITGL